MAVGALASRHRTEGLIDLCRGSQHFVDLTGCPESNGPGPWQVVAPDTHPS